MARGLPVPGLLATRGTGDTIVNHRSSWVQKVATDDGDVFVKTYIYPTWSDRLRNWGKWTAPFRQSRAARECQALNWLQAHDFATAKPLACLEWRTCGFLARATLVTEAFRGEVADQILASASEPQRRDIAAAIAALVVRLHAAGFRDRNLDLRNLLVQQNGAHLTVAKIDSPRFRLVGSGHQADRLADADWQRLLPQLAKFEVADVAQAHRRR